MFTDILCVGKIAEVFIVKVILLILVTLCD